MASDRTLGSVDRIRAVEWREGALRLLDQRRLPAEERYLSLDSAAEVAAAIRDMVVRGAPAIGIAAAYGVVLAARHAHGAAGADWPRAVEPEMEGLAAARPTAVNLAWALARMRRVFPEAGADPEARLLAEARAIHEEDIAANRRMGALGAGFIDVGARILTHCNTGSLATGGFGTALGVVRSAFAAGRVAEVYAGETRPWLQGARLTAWELVRDGIPVRLVADGAAAWLMRRRGIHWVIVGADRVAANGDVANKIGTYALAIAARHHGARLMVVAPSSTLDPAVSDGSRIPVEDRDPRELLELGGQPIAADGAGAWNPVFDITPAELVDVLVTERGAVERPDAERLAALLR